MVTGQYPYCKTDLPPCPIIGLSQTYNQLPIAQDEQCNGLYGGLLCRSCREDAVFSFEAVKCIPCIVQTLISSSHKILYN